MYYSGFYFPATCFCVRETAASLSYGRKGALADWPEEELARIRVVLHKLTCLRIENPADAEDLVQDTLLTMALRCPDVTIEKGLLIWAMGILRNKVGNYYRKTRRSAALAFGTPAYDLGRAESFRSPEAKLQYAELCRLVRRILDDLSPPERRPLEMFLAGIPTAQIAANLQPELYQNVVNRLHRGRRKVAVQLTNLGYGEGLKAVRNGAGPRKPTIQP